MESSQLPGVYMDGSGTNPASRQPAGVLSTWIDEQLRDIQANQVARLAQIRKRLQSGVFEWDNALLGRAIELLREQADELEFDPVPKRGIFSMFRRPPEPGRFTEHYASVVAAADAVRTHADELAASHLAHTSGARRVLLELELEQQSLASDMGQAIEWLAAMSEDMHRRGSDPAHDERLALLAKRAEFFAGHLKRLHVLQESAAGICAIGRNVIERRAALIEQLKVNLEGFQRVWKRRVGALANEAAQRPSSAVVDAAFEAHGELVARMEDTHAACEALQLEEHQMGLRLAAMRAELDALSGTPGK